MTFTGQTIFMLGNASGKYASRFVSTLDKQSLLEALKPGVDRKVLIQSSFYAFPVEEETGTKRFHAEKPLPYAARLCVLPDSFIEEACFKEFENEDPWKRRVLLVESFPSGTRQIAGLLRDIKGRCPDMGVRVLLWDDNRRFGATDMGDETLARKKAEEEYEKILPGCVIRREQFDLYSLRYGMTRYFMSAFKKNMDSVKYFLDNFDSEWEYAISECRGELTSATHRYTKYKNLDRDKPIMISYRENYRNEVLKNDGKFFKAIFEFYQGAVKPALLWDINEDYGKLFSSIEDGYLQGVGEIKEGMMQKPASEKDYITNKEIIVAQIAFRGYISDDDKKGLFWKRIVPDAVKSLIERRYEALNKIVSNNRLYQEVC